MKIAHIVRRFTFSEWGGTESVVWHIAREQKAQGLTPVILCTAALDKVGTEVIEGITIRRFPYFYPYIPMPEKDKLALDKKGGNPFVYTDNHDYPYFRIHGYGENGEEIPMECLPKDIVLKMYHPFGREKAFDTFDDGITYIAERHQ